MRRNPNKRQHESVPYAEATIKTLDPTVTYDRSCGQKARAESSAGGIEQNEGIFKSQPLPRHREPSLVDALLRAKQDAIPANASTLYDPEPVSFLPGGDPIENACGQFSMHFGIDTNRVEFFFPRHCRCSVPRAMSDTPDYAVRPARLPERARQN